MENKKTGQEIIEEMQLVVEQMRLDDIEDDPSSVDECFDCDCCGQTKPFAGSIDYNGYRLCNDCVLLAETGFALGRITDIDDLINFIEDKHLEQLCDFIKQEEKREQN